MLRLVWPLTLSVTLALAAVSVARGAPPRCDGKQKALEQAAARSEAANAARARSVEALEAALAARRQAAQRSSQAGAARDQAYAAYAGAQEAVARCRRDATSAKDCVAQEESARDAGAAFKRARTDDEKAWGARQAATSRYLAAARQAEDAARKALAASESLGRAAGAHEDCRGAKP